ncbi:MAG TPA: hypothetical protein ENI77_13030 [Nitrospirae bacterium]|nr:hypothetical protein [Nitrospirota bacterium]
MAVNYNIPLVFYAEHGESEYGGKVMHKDSNKIRDFAEVIEHQIGDDPANWVDDDVTEADLNPYLYPPMDAVERVGVTAFYFAYFFRWSMFDNYEYVKSKMPFKTHPKGRTSGTFTNFDSLDDKIDPLYYYMQFIKFGFGRTVRDGSRLIQNKHITREQGLEYAHNYDAEFPQDNIGEALDYLQLSREQFDMIVDQHRNQELWIQEEGEWRLRYPLPPLGAKV